MNNEPLVTVIGGGLAGSEAAWQAAERGVKVRLYEMRPVRPTPAHQSDKLGEIVCSNSLKTDQPGTAPYLLKEELRRGGSLLISVAHENSVPAGSALAVDRAKRERLANARRALDAPAAEPVPMESVAVFCLRVMHRDIHRCPVCHIGQLRILAALPVCTHRARPP